MTSIDTTVFGSCPNLVSVTLNANDIVSKTYTYSSNLKTIFGTQVLEYILGNDITSIGNYAFYNSSNLTSITIPESVTSIGSWAFNGCSGLTSITIPESVTSIGESAFRDCSGLTSITIPESVTSIGNYTFLDCSGLKSITIPNSVTSIGFYAFSGCSSLKKVYCMAKQVPTTKSSAFYNNDVASATLYVPASAVDDYQSTAPWSSFGTFLAIDEHAYITGDANGNGEVEIGDVTSVLTLMATPDATGYNNKAADANGNGVIEIGDVTTILTIMAEGD